MNVIKLPHKFIGTGDVKGFEFKRIKESENAYMYAVSDNGTMHYEVFYKKSYPVCIDFDNRIYSDNDTKEVYPKSKFFGKEAWCIRNINKAKDKFYSISNE